MPTAAGHDPATSAVTTLADEKQINTFLRLSSPSVIGRLRENFPDLPDQPGNCSRVFNSVATGHILVDMIVQNITSPGRAELSFTAPKTDLTRALKRTQDVAREIDPAARVAGESDIAILYVTGVGMRTHTGVARTMFGALAKRGINIAMINTSEVCVSVVVDADRGDEALECLKEAFKLS